MLLTACSPRVATSFWRIGTLADSVRPGYTVIHAEGKTRHCYPITQWDASTNIDTYHQLHHHGVAVESEQMAYRIYFDKKQTIDVYCKRTPRLELAESHWYPNDSLLAEGYGDDILRVSGTIGVGSVKFWNGQKQVHIEADRRFQRIVEQSRDKATIAVGACGCRIPRDTTEAENPRYFEAQYTMRAGHRDMRCDVYADYPFENLCTGVQSIPAKGPQPTADSQWLSEELPNGILLASWGTDWPVNDSAKYAKETVGLGVFIPKKYAGLTVHDKQNNLCLLNLPATNDKQQTTSCHFYLTVCGATKENHPVATSAEEWFRYLRRWARKLK